MSYKKVKEGGCPDCGNAPVNHRVEKMTNILTLWMDPLIKPVDRIWRHIEPTVNRFLNYRFLPKFYKLLHKLHMGKIAHVPDDKLTGRARSFWLECESRGIKVWEFQLFGMGRELFVAEWGGKSRAFDNLPRPGDRESGALYWMDDKGRMRVEFEKAGIPVAQGGKYFSWKSLSEAFDKLTKPVIIKPHTGSRSRHTTTHIETIGELRVAFDKAKQLSPFVIMEEEHKGFVYRGTIIGGEVIGVIRREPAHVVGDGVSTVIELLEKENAHPMRTGEIFHKITLGDEAEEEMRRQDIKLSDIPARGRVVTFSQKSSRGLGGGITDVTDVIHPDNLEILNNIHRVLQDPLVGVDFMIDDIEKSWKDQDRCGVIECNSMPFIELHLFPLRGQVRDTAAALCDIAFPGSKRLVSR